MREPHCFRRMAGQPVRTWSLATLLYRERWGRQRIGVGSGEDRELRDCWDEVGSVAGAFYKGGLEAPGAWMGGREPGS